MSLAAFGHFQNGVLQLHPNFSVSHFDGLTLDDIDFAEILGSGRVNSDSDLMFKSDSADLTNNAEKTGSGRANSGLENLERHPDSEDKTESATNTTDDVVYSGKNLLIDARDVQHCDSIGIAALLWLLQQANAENLTLKCIHLPPKMQQLLKLYELPFLEDSSNYARRID